MFSATICALCTLLPYRAFAIFFSHHVASGAELSCGQRTGQRVPVDVADNLQRADFKFGKGIWKNAQHHTAFSGVRSADRSLRLPAV